MRSIEHVVLERAKRLVEQGWTCFRYAANEFDYDCELFDPHAAQFCTGAALLRAAVEVVGETEARSMGGLSLKARLAHSRARELLEHANKLTTTIEAYNDGATKEEVLAAFDRALAFDRTPERV
jgi:hypothetical protein